MTRSLRRTILILAAVGLGVFVWIKTFETKTQQASPLAEVSFTVGDLKADVRYCQPSKRDRVIFGSLVPYGIVWRTGANDATTITFNKAITFGGSPVPAGTYTLWTIPGGSEWSVILNKKMYGWGIDVDGKAMRDPLEDIAIAKVTPKQRTSTLEMFTISVVGPPPVLVLEWDQTLVAVPLDR